MAHDIQARAPTNDGEGVPGELRLLRHLAEGRSPGQLATDICRHIEEQIRDCRASVLLLDPASNTLSALAGPSLPPEYVASIQGASIGADLASCSQAAYSGEPVVTPDIHGDSGWAAFADIAIQYNFSGSWSWPLRNADGPVVGTLGLYFDQVRDATDDDRKTMDSWAELASRVLLVALDGERSERLARTWPRLLSASDIVTLSCSSDGDICAVHSSPETVRTNYRAILVGRTLHDLFAKEGDTQLEDALARCLESEEPVRIGTYSVELDGESRRWKCSLAENPDSTGPTNSILLLARDVTEEHDLRRRWSHRQRIRSVGSIGAGIAHEVNNPLAYIEGNAEFIDGRLSQLGEDASTEDVSELLEALEDLKEGVSRIKSIVGDLTAYSRVQDEITSISVLAAAESARNMIEMEVGNGFLFDIDVADDLFIRGNETRFTQVLVNLGRNALQAMQDHKENLQRIELRAFTDDGQVIVEFSDNGPGIPEEARERVFETFYTTRPSSGGTGLGLSIVRDILDDMHGTIHIEESASGGAKFRMEFVRADVDETPEDGDASEPDRRLTILLIDDDERFGKTLSRMLDGEHDLIVESEPEKALRMLIRNGDFDVILLDLMMPGIDGARLAQRLEVTHPELAQRIGFVTGGIQSDEVSRYVRKSDRPIRYKPIDRPTLDALLAELSQTSKSNGA